MKPAAIFAEDVNPDVLLWPAWVNRAACRGQHRAPREVLKKICTTCPVRGECLEWAMRIEGGAPVGNRGGVFGGLSEKQRYALYIQRKAP